MIRITFNILIIYLQHPKDSKKVSHSTRFPKRFPRLSIVFPPPNKETFLQGFFCSDRSEQEATVLVGGEFGPWSKVPICWILVICENSSILIYPFLFFLLKPWWSKAILLPVGWWVVEYHVSDQVDGGSGWMMSRLWAGGNVLAWDMVMVFAVQHQNFAPHLSPTST